MLPIIRKFKIIIRGLFYTIGFWLLLRLILSSQLFSSLDLWLESNDLFFYKWFFKASLAKNVHTEYQEYKHPHLVVIDVGKSFAIRSCGEYAKLINFLKEKKVA